MTFFPSHTPLLFYTYGRHLAPFICWHALAEINQYNVCLRPLLLLAVFGFKQICLLLHLAQNLDWFDNTKSSYVTLVCEKYSVCFLPSLSNYDNKNANTVQVCWQETQRVCHFSWLCTEGGRRTPWAGICFIYPKRAVLIQLSWKKLSAKPKPTTKSKWSNLKPNKLWVLFFHDFFFPLFSMGTVSIQSDPQKPASYHVFSHLPIITLKSLFLYYNLQTISSKGSPSPSFSPAHKAIPVSPWRDLGFYFQTVPMQAHLKPGGEMDSRVFCPLTFISYFQAQKCHQWSTSLSFQLFSPSLCGLQRSWL